MLHRIPTFNLKWLMPVDNKRKSSKGKQAAAGVSESATGRTISELKKLSKQEAEANKGLYPAIRACLLLVRTKAHWSTHCWRPNT